MPSTPKPPGASNPGKAEELSFEDALKKLESIVESMESEDLPLEALLSKYEQGTHLAKTCQEKLAEAEVKIRQLEQDSSGEIKAKPFTPGQSEVE